MKSAYAIIGALLLVCSGSVIADNLVMGNAYRVDAEQRFENVPIGAKPLPARARSRSGLCSARMLHDRSHRQPWTPSRSSSRVPSLTPRSLIRPV